MSGKENERAGARDWDSRRAIFKEAVTGEARSAAMRESPAGPPPTQTMS